MPMTDPLKQESCDVAIIGAGPAGLSAAIELKKSGVECVVVLEREAEAGGIPRHCAHPPYGIREYKRVLTGPTYAKKLVETAHNAGVSIALKQTVTKLEPRGILTVASPEGLRKLTAKRVLLATGTRETPRSTQLVSGDRALGICNTGTLQSMFYLKNMVPFRRPVVVGTEIVSFSALFTCKKAKIQPVAMLEEGRRPTVRWPIHYAARVFGVPLLLETQIEKIIGDNRVEAVLIKDKDGNIRELACDGILFTGKFTPESTLARMSHLQLDNKTGSPIIDRFGRCSDPAYYSAGNVQQYYPDGDTSTHVPIYYTADNLPQPVEVAGQCWNEGRMTAEWIVKDLGGTLS
ncbi:MAG: pyridine nucleotide-disulfide oxidoreductase [Deltaproteobacteria bacterium]|nr:MAG: pyridine nucleotide-disulfide oxidoreductase [Deltaproteobacteria bacterium]